METEYHKMFAVPVRLDKLPVGTTFRIKDDDFAKSLRMDKCRCILQSKGYVDRSHGIIRAEVYTMDLDCPFHKVWRADALAHFMGQITVEVV